MTQEFITFQKLIIGHLSQVKMLNYIKNHLKKQFLLETNQEMSKIFLKNL